MSSRRAPTSQRQVIGPSYAHALNRPSSYHSLLRKPRIRPYHAFFSSLLCSSSKCSSTLLSCGRTRWPRASATRLATNWQVYPNGAPQLRGSGVHEVSTGSMASARETAKAPTTPCQKPRTSRRIEEVAQHIFTLILVQLSFASSRKSLILCKSRLILCNRKLRDATTNHSLLLISIESLSTYV
jgi:hypothetical protein